MSNSSSLSHVQLKCMCDAIMDLINVSVIQHYMDLFQIRHCNKEINKKKKKRKSAWTVSLRLTRRSQQSRVRVALCKMQNCRLSRKHWARLLCLNRPTEIARCKPDWVRLQRGRGGVEGEDAKVKDGRFRGGEERRGACSAAKWTWQSYSGYLPVAAYAAAFAFTICSATQCLTVANAVMHKQWTAVCAGGVHLLIRLTGSFPLLSQPKSATFFFSSQWN